MIVSINIVAYNEEENISNSLESALSQTYSPVEVFLVDNASVDKTIEKAEKIYRDSGSAVKFTVVRNEANLGFGGGHNVGFEKSSGDFVLCLNADCALDKDYVKYAVETFGRDARIAAVQGKLLNPRTGKIDTTGLVIFKNRRVINRGQGDPDRGQFQTPEEIWGVDGAAPVYRRVALDDTKIGGEYFDADFFAYKEDVDLSWRMRWAGWTMAYEPRAVAYHDRSAGEGTAKNPLEIIKARRGISYFAKFHSFANQRLMQIKNETPYLFFKYFPQIFVKEIMSWPYVLVLERYGWKSALEFFRLIPRTIKKRKVVMAKRRISDSTMEKWFY